MRLFRYRRTKNLSVERFGRYLLYALGEIVLVVIGILIALNLNERKAEADERKAEMTYLRRFQGEIEQNLEELERVVAETGRVLVVVDSILDISLGRIPPIDRERFWELSGSVLEYTIFHSEESTIEDLLGSGQLNIIRNERIRETFATWRSGLISIRTLEGDFKKVFDQLIAYYNANLPIYKYNYNNRSQIISGADMAFLLSDREFLNLINYLTFPASGLHREYQKKRDELMAVRQIVSDEITQLQKRR